MATINNKSLIKSTLLCKEEFYELMSILSKSTIFDYVEKYCTFVQSTKKIDINKPVSDIENIGKLLERSYYICNELLLRFKIDVITKFDKIYLNIEEFKVTTDRSIKIDILDKLVYVDVDLMLI